MKYLPLILLSALVCQEISAQTKLRTTSISGENMPGAIETEYGKTLLNHDHSMVYFVKTYDFALKKGRMSQVVWEANWNQDKTLKNTAVTKDWNDYNNNAVVGVSKDGNRIYLLGTYSNKERMWPGISVSEYSDAGWSAPEKVDVEKLHIKSKFFDFHVTPDEQAMFISMGSSLYGQAEIYVSKRTPELTWSKPVLLNTVNTDTTDEISPFFSEDFNTLYFSSNRGSGLGGFDVYASERGSDWTHWGEPKLMPEPYNSKFFDAYFSAYEADGAFVVSNRKDSLSKIFHFEDYGKPSNEKEKNVVKSKTIAEGEYTQISGKFIYDGLPKEGVEIVLVDKYGNVVSTTMTDAKGLYEFSKLPKDERYSIVYLDGDDKLNPDYANLEERDAEASEAIKNIDGLFEYEGLPKEDVLIVLVDDKGNVMGQSYTDKDGLYEFKSLSADHFYKVFYVDEHDEYNPKFANTGEIDSKDLPPNFMAELQKQNQEVEYGAARFKIIYDDKLPQDAKAILKNTNTSEVSNVGIEKDGSFEFKELNRNDYYELSFSNELDQSKMKVYNNQHDNQDELAFESDDFIAVKPEMIYPDMELDMDRFNDDVAFAKDNKKEEPIKKKKQPSEQLSNSGKADHIVLYAFNEVIPNGTATIMLDNTVLRDKSKTLLITGHTDNVGSEEVNKRVSEQRANYVKDYLVTQGYDAAKITTKGIGESSPRNTNETPDGRAKNRRVEIEFR